MILRKTEQANKILVQKVKEFDEFKALQANKEFIEAQIKAKPFMKELIEQLGIKTQADYIRIAMPLEEREESVYKAQKQIEKNHTKDIINEYGITVGSASTKNEKLVKAAKESVDLADDLFKEWGIV